MKGILGAFGALFFNHRGGAGASERTDDRHAAPAKPLATILLIDDDSQLLDSTRTLLQGAGFNVLTAQSGPKGLDMLRYSNGDVKVVLLDYDMPKFTGAETLMYLRKLAPNAKVVAVTGIDSQFLPENFTSGVDRFLRKPLRSSEIVSCLNALLPVPAPAPAAA